MSYLISFCDVFTFYLVVLCDSDSDWWFAHNMSTSQQGYIPSNHLAKEDTLETNE